MKSLKIGHVDIDTSHPPSWIPIEREMGHTVVGICDHGAVYDEGYVKKFAQDYEIPKVFKNLEDMAETVDVAMIHSCNWDVHVDRARPFIEAGKAVLIDKPMVGNLVDANQLSEWAKAGHTITGGSALYYCDEIMAYKQEACSTRGEPLFIYGGCGVDEFNYGIHAYAMVHSLMGPGVQSVRYMGSNIQRQIEIEWNDGRKAILVIGEAGAYLPFYVTVLSDRAVRQITVDNNKLYRALLEAVLPYLAGETDAQVAMETLLEVEKAAMAARESWSSGGKRVFLTDLRLDDPGYDGAAFAAAYKLSKIGK